MSMLFCINSTYCSLYYKSVKFFFDDIFTYENTYSNYFRIHRSYIVNCDFITKYSNKEGGAITLSNGSSLPLSRNRKDDFIKFTKSIEENYKPTEKKKILSTKKMPRITLISKIIR